MSGNATTQSTDRERFRARPVASRQPLVASPSSEAQPPVLFRFPNIAAPLVADHGPPETMPVAANAEAERHVPTEPQTEPSHSTIQPKADSTATASAPEQVVQTKGTARCVAADAEDTQFSALAAEQLSVNECNSAVVSTCAPQSSTATSAAPARTWWEHWSSGVVLILLIIALVTASIIALNDGNPSRNQPLASELETAAVDEFDLSSISIPDITLGSLSTLDSSGMPATATAGTLPATAGTIAGSQPPAESVAESTTAIGTQPLVEAPSLGAPAIEPATTEVQHQVAEAPPGPASSGAVSSGEPLQGSLELTSAELQAATVASIPSNIASTIASQPVQIPQATLATPVGVAPPQLFANGPARTEQPVNNTVATIPASGPTASLSVPLRAGGSSDGPANSTAAGNALVPGTNSPNAGRPGTPGASPEFYDGAALRGELHASTVYNGEGMADTNLPSFPAMLASSSSATTGSTGHGVNATSGSVFTTAAHTQPTNEPIATAAGNRLEANYAQPSAAAGIVINGATLSATPGSDSDAMIKAYLKFQELNRASTAEGANRYGTAGGSGGGISGGGFTLGNPPTITAPATSPAR